MKKNESEIMVGDRRPIKSREMGWAKRVAARMAARGFSPNGISLAGMVAGMLGGCALASTRFIPDYARIGWLLGALMVQLRLLANMFDGMVAIESKRTSLVGDLYNEIPDRVSDFAIFSGLGCSVGGNPVLGLLVAAMAIFVAYIRAQGKASGAQNEFCGPMAKPQRMFVVTLASLYCALTPSSVQVFGGGRISSWALGVIGVGCLITAWRRLIRIARCLNEGGANE